MTIKFANAVIMAQRLLKERLAAATCAIDATAGNGRDTLFLAQSTPLAAAVLSFDIQPLALRRTYELLDKHLLAEKVQMINDCHSNIDLYVKQAVDVAVFNLGYLPGGEHSITTSSEKVLEALRKLLLLLKADGLVSLVTYPGHMAGRVEDEAVREFLKQLKQKEYDVGCWSAVNQINDPPVLYMVHKKRGE